MKPLEYSIIGNRIFVEGHFFGIDQAIKRLGGQRTRDGYHFPAYSAAEVIQIIDERNALMASTEQTPARPAVVEPVAATMAPGWSKAARRRTGRTTSRSHPLGEAVEVGQGYTIYEDSAFGGGRVQIWDQS